MKKLIFLFLILFPLVAQAQIPWGIDSAITAASGSITGGTCTNEVVTAIDTSGVPTCAPVDVTTMLTGVNAGTNIANDLEEETHATEHSTGGGDTITATNLASACTDAQVLGGNAGATGVECQADDDVPDTADFGNLNLATSNHTNVLPMASGGVLQVNSTGHGFFAFFVNVPSAAAGTMSITANQNRCFVTYMDRMVTVDRAFVQLVGTGAAGCEASVGLYDSSGTFIRKSTIIDCTAGGGAGVKTPTFTEVTVGPGIYYSCMTSDDSTPTWRSISTNASTAAIMNNSSTSMVATTANASANGVLPDTLGALTDSVSDCPLVWYTK